LNSIRCRSRLSLEIHQIWAKRFMLSASGLIISTLLPESRSARTSRSSGRLNAFGTA
jgi:hypothetical protein